MLINYTHQLPAGTLELIERFRIPAVWLNSKREHDAVYPDEVGVGMLAGEHLVRHARRGVALLQCHADRHFSEADRWEGLSAACGGAGVAAVRVEVGSEAGHYYELNPERDTRLAEVIAWLRQPDRPDAVLGYSSLEAVLLCQAAAVLGLSIPHNLAVVAIHDKAMASLGLPLPTVLLPQHEMGVAAVRELAAKIESPRRPRPARVIPARLSPGGVVLP